VVQLAQHVAAPVAVEELDVGVNGKYSRPERSPVTSTWTEWPSSGIADAVPDLTTRRKRESVATCQRTRMSFEGTPPPAMSGSGARRVQSETPFGVGSPEATPSRNG
jgi:hypothetical protein